MANWREILISGSDANLQSLKVDNDALISGSIHLSKSIHDTDDNTGTLGQVLSSTVSGSQWVDAQSGPKGAQGATGAAAQGTTGAQGAKGDAGAQGSSGEKGSKGQKGEVGAQGTDGEKGQPGAKGGNGNLDVKDDGQQRVAVLGNNGAITGSADFTFGNTGLKVGTTFSDIINSTDTTHNINPESDGFQTIIHHPDSDGITIFNNDYVGIDAALTVGRTGSYSTTKGRIDATNDIVAFSTSDLNFKSNIEPIKGSLDKVMEINGVEFDWKPLTKEEKVYLHGNEGHDIGVIAQEIEKVLPEVVTTRESGYKAVRYEKIIPLLIEAIKELKQEIDSLKNE